MEDKCDDQRPVSFFVEGEPVAQPRPKFASRGKFGTAYTPGKLIKPWRDKVALIAASNVRGQIKGAVEVVLKFNFERPKGHFRSGKYSDQLKPNAPVMHTQKPDIDNLEKAVLDALVKKGVIEDDSNVVWIQARKQWARPEKDVEGVLVTIRPVNI